MTTADLDPERLRRAALIALESYPLWRRDQLAAAINDGHLEIVDLDDEWIACHADGVKLFAARREVVARDTPGSVE